MLKSILALLIGVSLYAAPITTPISGTCLIEAHDIVCSAGVPQNSFVDVSQTFNASGTSLDQWARLFLQPFNPSPGQIAVMLLEEISVNLDPDGGFDFEDGRQDPLGTIGEDFSFVLPSGLEAILSSKGITGFDADISTIVNGFSGMFTRLYDPPLNAVPEPGTWVLVGIGLLFCLNSGKRRTLVHRHKFVSLEDLQKFELR